MHEIQHKLPHFEKGDKIFASEFFFDYEEMLGIVKEFRRKIFEFLSRKNKECLATAEVQDKEFL